jgi:alkanesulfonate monooxygenase SsuD/methylene tetrahydromethanopterin reductase-like flavin-dependent oxidoreductase (luciferase family)
MGSQPVREEAMQQITINLNVLTLDRLFGGARAFVEQARAIEDAGIDGIVMPDHVVFGTNVQYPFGGWAVNPADTWPEPMAVLAAAAGATRRVALVTNVLIAPLRSAALLAKQAATLFQLSDGRFQLGVGTGWQRQEYEASGLSFAQRADFLFDQMRACRALWRGESTSFQSPHVSLDRIWCSPGVPDQDGRSPLPLWFGLAPSAANARFFAEFPAAGWSCINPDAQAIAQGRAALQKTLREQFGIDRALRIRAAPAVMFDAAGNACVERTIASLAQSVHAGVTDFDFPLLFLGRGREQFKDLIHALGRVERRIERY